MTIICAICFFDPAQSGLRNPGMVTYEQNIFYSILRKLVISQSRRSSNCSSIASSTSTSSSSSSSSDAGSTNSSTATTKQRCERINILKPPETAQVTDQLTSVNEPNPVEGESDPIEGVSSALTGKEVPTTKVSTCCSGSSASSSFLFADQSIAQDLEEKIFTRLRVIQESFENSILVMDPGKQIKIISRELELSCAKNVPM